jgi:hypothetical protein
MIKEADDHTDVIVKRKMACVGTPLEAFTDDNPSIKDNLHSLTNLSSFGKDRY